MNKLLKKTMSEEGSALGLVLVFVTILGVWLGAIFLVGQISTSGVQRLAVADSNSNVNSSLSASILQQLSANPGIVINAITKTTTTGTGSLATTMSSNCGLTGLALPPGYTVNCIVLPNTGLTSTSFSTPNNPATGTQGITTLSGPTTTGSKMNVGAPVDAPVYVKSGNVNDQGNKTATPTAASTSSITPGGGGGVVTPSDHDDGDSSEHKITWPSTCSDLESKGLHLTHGHYTATEVKQLNYLTKYKKMWLLNNDGELQDATSSNTKDCSKDSNKNIEIDLGDGQYYFDGGDLDLNDGGDHTWSIKVRNESSSSSFDSKSNTCSYSGTFVANPTKQSEIRGAEIIIGSGSSWKNTSADTALCGPRTSMGAGPVFAGLSSSDIAACRAKYGSTASSCNFTSPGIRGGSKYTFDAPIGSGQTKARNFIYGSVYVPTGDVHMSQDIAQTSATGALHRYLGGVTANQVYAACTVNCTIVNLTSSDPGSTYIQITITNPNGTTSQHIYKIDASGHVTVIN